MTALTPILDPVRDLPGLIDRAASMLSNAKTSAEVLEARETAGLAYDKLRKRLDLARDAKVARERIPGAIVANWVETRR